MDSIKWAAVIAFCRKFILPAALGAIVVWFIANGLSAWVPVVCGVADALAVVVQECKQ